MHRTGAQTDELRELAVRGIHGRCDRDRVAGEHLPGLGEAHATTRPHEQRHPEPRFGPTQVLTDGGLAVAEGASRAADRAVLGDRPHDAYRMKVEVAHRHNST